MTHLNRRTVVGGILAGLHDGVAADGGTFDLLAHPLRVHVATAVDGGVHVWREGVSDVRIRGAEPESAASSPDRPGTGRRLHEQPPAGAEVREPRSQPSIGPITFL